MSIVTVDVEQQAGSGTVIADPDGSGFHIQLPETTVEVSQAQLLGITQAGTSLLGLVSTSAKPAFMGDSNMVERPGVPVAQTFPAVMAAALGASSYGLFAFGGENSSHGVNRIQAVLDYAPSVVFIDYGVNDADTAQGITGAVYEANMRKIIGAFLARGIKVVLMAPIFVAITGYVERQRDSYMPSWYRLAGIPGVTYVDCYAQMASMFLQDGNRTRFDSLYNGSDFMHWGANGNTWRRDRCKEALGI